MSIETILLDAGGVLAVPNWERVSAILRAQGIEIQPLTLAAADHLAKFEIDVGSYIGISTDWDRWHRYFELMFAHASIPLPVIFGRPCLMRCAPRSSACESEASASQSCRMRMDGRVRAGRSERISAFV